MLTETHSSVESYCPPASPLEPIGEFYLLYHSLPLLQLHARGFVLFPSALPLFLSICFGEKLVRLTVTDSSSLLSLSVELWSTFLLLLSLETLVCSWTDLANFKKHSTDPRTSVTDTSSPLEQPRKQIYGYPAPPPS